MTQVRLRYWAGARAAAAAETETVTAGSVAEALARASAARAGDAEFARVLAACSILLDGSAIPRDRWDAPLGDGAELEILPPFAGG